jgi:hypothetical protein
MRKTPTVRAAIFVCACAAVAAYADEVPAWTIKLRPGDFVIGPALAQLSGRHTWPAGFDGQSGDFEIALRKTAVAIPAPNCRMNYLILQIPFYYTENPKQASVSECRAIYEAFVAFQAGGKGLLTTSVEAPSPFARRGPRGIGLAVCNLLFAFPLSVQVSAQ